MRLKCLGLLLALGLAAVPAAPTPLPVENFSGVVRQLGLALDARPEHRFLLGMVGFFARISRPDGVRGLQIALLPAPAGADWRHTLDLDGVASAHLNPGWSRMVRTSERHRHMQTLVYVRPDGADFRMLVLNFNGFNQVAVVGLHLRPDQVFDEADAHTR